MIPKEFGSDSENILLKMILFRPIHFWILFDKNNLIRNQNSGHI